MIALWLLSCFGLTWIITRSVIFERVRALAPKPMGTTPFFGTLLRCPQCMGFWVGVLHSLLFPIFHVNGAPLGRAWVTEALLSGWISSGTCYLAMLVCEKLGQEPLDELASSSMATTKKKPAPQAIWEGDRKVAKRVYRGIERWNSEGGPILDLKLQTVADKGDETTYVLGIFEDPDDYQDACAYADGFADGLEDALEDDEEEDEDGEEDEEDEDD